jgi:hypothetical protein
MFFIQVAAMVESQSDKFVTKSESCYKDETVTFPMEFVMKLETEEEKKFPEVKLQLLRVY